MAQRTLEDLTLRLHDGDEVVIATEEIPAGKWTIADGGALTVRATIPRGHKLATTAVGDGEPVRKYGQVIGFATRPIAAGRPRTHPQPRLPRDAVDYEFGADLPPDNGSCRVRARATFEGYRPPRRPGRHPQLSSAS